MSPLRDMSFQPEATDPMISLSPRISARGDSNQHQPPSSLMISGVEPGAGLCGLCSKTATCEQPSRSIDSIGIAHCFMGAVSSGNHNPASRTIQRPICDLVIISVLRILRAQYLMEINNGHSSHD